MAARSSRFEVLFRLLQVSRWDEAFDIAWAANGRLPSIKSPNITDATALAVRNSGNHASGREFATRMARYMALAKHPVLEIAWEMLAADVDKPETILKFCPQLAYSFDLEAAAFFGDTDELFEVRRRLGHWMEAAEGRFKGSTRSMFTMAVTGRAASSIGARCLRGRATSAPRSHRRSRIPTSRRALSSWRRRRPRCCTRSRHSTRIWSGAIFRLRSRRT